MKNSRPGEGSKDGEDAMPAQGSGPAIPGIPGFDPVRELGRGGTATVWLATEQRSGTSYAVKCFDRGASGEGPDHARSALLREVNLLSRLDHEHLVKLRGVVQLAGGSDGGLGLLMDYAPGGSLRQLVSSRGRLSIGEAVTIVTPLAQALAYLHRDGMTHGDVSPGNVLFTAQGKPLLADLGVSRMVGDACGVPDSGTPGFADPVPVAGQQAELRPERDTYALAALGWYCLTGSAPGDAARRTPLTLLVPGVPPALAAALEAGLHPDPQQRPTAAELGIAVYRSAAPAPVDLSGSVHATVVPELLTRRRAPEPQAKRARIAALFGRFRPPPGRARAGSPSTRAGSLSKGTGHRRRRAAAIGLVLGMCLLAGSAMTAWWAGDRGPSVADQRPSTTPTPGQGEAVHQERGREGQGGQVDSQAGPDGVPAAVLDSMRSERPEEAVRGLSALRDAAFRTGRLELLEHVNAQDSAAAAADRKTTAELERAGLVLAGFSTTLLSVGVEGLAGPDTATVAVTLETSAYEERDASGKVVRAHPRGTPQELRLVLSRGDGPWRITDILAKQA